TQHLEDRRKKKQPISLRDIQVLEEMVVENISDVLNYAWNRVRQGTRITRAYEVNVRYIDDRPSGARDPNGAPRFVPEIDPVRTGLVRYPDRDLRSLSVVPAGSEDCRHRIGERRLGYSSIRFRIVESAQPGLRLGGWNPVAASSDTFRCFRDQQTRVL